jgi:hypothetical protein
VSAYECPNRSPGCTPTDPCESCCLDAREATADRQRPPARPAVHDTVHGAAVAMARSLAEHGYAAAYIEPGDATRYDVTLVWRHDGLLLALANLSGRCYLYGSPTAAVPVYVADTLDVSDHTGGVMTDLLVQVAGELQVLTGILL